MKILPSTVISYPASGDSRGDSTAAPSAGVNDETFGGAPLDPGAALVEFPELRRLVDLIQAGWQFLPVSTGVELVEVRGVREWPDEWMDALTVRFTTDAAGLRRDRSGGVVWERAGDLADVVDGLLALPAPSDPDAPRLVLRTSTRLWTPLRQFPRHAVSFQPIPPSATSPGHR